MEVGVFLLLLYLALFCMMLNGCCLRKPKSEGIEPVRPETEDEDVKAERERVQRLIEGTGGEVLLVNDLVKQYKTADPDADK